MNQADIPHFRQRLLDRREEIFNHQKTLDQSWRNLQERTTEPEEAAQKETISSGVNQLSQREQEELRAIDAALQRTHDGTYGECASCGEAISKKRLEAVPWTPLCMSCADQGRTQRMAPSQTDKTPLAPPPDPTENYSEKSDQELCQAIYEEIENDGRVPVDTLEITCTDGVIFLRGSVPTQLNHKTLLAILEDTMHLEDIVDEVEILSEFAEDEPAASEEGTRE
jgi:RNA polymerase-binding protein DksA